MKTRQSARSLAIFAMALAAIPSTTTRAQTQPPLPRYTIVDLGSLAGGTSSQAGFVSNNNLIIGESSMADGTLRATLWGGPFRIDIGPHGVNSLGIAINEKGQVSLDAESTAKDPHNENFCGFGTGLKCFAYLLQGGVTTRLPTLGGNNAEVGNINNRGEIVGTAENSTLDPACAPGVAFDGTGPQVLDYKAVIWGPTAGSIRELRPLPGDTVGVGLWINDSSQVAGQSGTCDTSILPPIAYAAHAVVWDSDSSVHDLGNLGSKAVNTALSINNQGSVAGTSSLSDDATPFSGVHAFLWTKAAGKMQDLGTLPGDVASTGLGINDADDVVGVSNAPDGSTRAFLWHAGIIRDLNDLVPSNSPLLLMFASWINSSGWIVGFGTTEKGDVHGFLAISSNGPTARADDVEIGLPASFRAAAAAAFLRNANPGEAALAAWQWARGHRRP